MARLLISDSKVDDVLTMGASTCSLVVPRMEKTPLPGFNSYKFKTC